MKHTHTLGLIQMFGVNSNACYRFQSHVYLKISAFWTLCENGRSRCQADLEILIVEVAGCGTIEGDRGKFQVRKTAMAAHYSLLYIASKKQGATIAVSLAWNFPRSPAMFPQPATLKINMSRTTWHLNLPFSRKVHNAEIVRYRWLSNRYKAFELTPLHTLWCLSNSLADVQTVRQHM